MKSVDDGGVVRGRLRQAGDSVTVMTAGIGKR
jgi:hypothetical protein